MIRRSRTSDMQASRLNSADTIASVSVSVNVSVGGTAGSSSIQGTIHSPGGHIHSVTTPTTTSPNSNGDNTIIVNTNSSPLHANGLYATLVNPQPPAGLLNSTGGESDSSSGSSPTSSPTDSATPVPTSASTRPIITASSSNQQQVSSNSSTPSPEASKYPYSIRLSPFVDHSSSMPGFYTGAVEREARDGSVIRVGRYEMKKDHQEGDNSPHVAPIVFKSKVVSRSHAEFVVQDGQWFVKDAKSSSGTFLNHIRLSPANEISRPFQLKDGDVLQLGVDFRGGVEEVYKCIKVRVELNRSWQKKPNNFNVNQLTNLRNLFVSPSEHTNGAGHSIGQENSQECAICLLPVSACQSLFIAPCSHSWHYKCIRPVIVKAYPHFLCPNCRAMCDLEADIEVPDLSHLEISQTDVYPKNNVD